MRHFGKTRRAAASSIIALSLLVVSPWSPAIAQVPPPPLPPGAPPVPPPTEPAPPVEPTPLELLAALDAQVAALPGNKGTRQSLAAKLKAAREALLAGDREAAVDALDSLVNHAQAQSGKHLTVEAADKLIAGADKLISRLL